MLSRTFSPALLAVAVLLAGPSSGAATGEAAERHGIAMHGEPALPPGFAHLPYANPQAPKGGRIAIGLQGTFDSLNPLVVIGVAPDAVPRYVQQSLLARALDEPFTGYGLLARSVEMPEDRSFVLFRLDPRARFSDGRPVTAEDVRFTFELLRQHGKPFHRSSLSQVKAVEIPDEWTIRFDLSGSDDRELPLIIGRLPIYPAHATDPSRFSATTLQAPIGSGPYRVTEVRPGERVVLARRRDWWAENHPLTRGLFNFDEIRYEFHRDGNTLFEAFKAGLTDVHFETDPARWERGYDVPAVREGRIKREAIPLRTPKGMGGFVFNTRRPLFADPRVREALGLVLDFPWINRNLFHGLVSRTGSYFDKSELSARGVPADERERALIAAFPDAIRPDILDGHYAPFETDGSGRDRDAARRALALLAEAGWTLENDGLLRRKAAGWAFAFEMLVQSAQQERLALNFAGALRRLGVLMRVRQVDNVQFWRRLGAFDFDMIQWTWAVSTSPGNEQRNRWGSQAAERPGSLNFAGVRSPAADRMIEAILAARSRDDFVSAVRAFDRVLLSGFYVVPLFHAPDQWIAYDAGLRRPSLTPLDGTAIELWWRERPD
jgi:peptide/nickel transport system substrate-binding protein